ncbi:hypothetical protein [Pseudemcibacter aquimaris]|uniref:hypothetical protein n=1 Tax=Pseudemcibacter aquimaris TaxID=2857064 RepID=UPI0020110FC8|nr:hypothetical protein [Pseudemcibacter aquimaris]MCC3862654.1 hypothetical protein [Pseudemcibacter aquimaris]WDU57753.1 hypothetical protein KW060_11150 [Pseudemcibacter aquimaris]
MEQIFNLQQNPLKHRIEEGLGEISAYIMTLNDDDQTAAENAFYLAVKKRMNARAYENDNNQYLSGLLEDVLEGQREFSQTCYANCHADNVFMFLKTLLTSLYGE